MKSLALLGALALISSSASAGFTGYSVDRTTTAAGNIQYKVYANVDASNFVALNVYNFQTVSGAAMNAIHNDNATDADENPTQSWSANSNRSANPLAGLGRNDDSWVTISGNSTAGGNDTVLDPSFVPSDASYIPYNAGWYDATPGNANTIPAGGTQGGYRMLIMQIVRAGGVQDLESTFTCVLGYKASSTTTALAGSGNFTIGLPTPGALALLGLAGLTGRRRRA